MNIHERTRTPIVFCTAVILFTLLLFVIPPKFISPDLGNTVLTISTFLFGMIAGFFIVVTTTDYNTLKGLTASETGKLIALYENVYAYDRGSADRLKILIDKYVRDAFDTELIDFAHHIQLDFEEIKKLVRELPAKRELSSLFQQIFGVMDGLIDIHQNEIVLGTRTVSPFQWFVLDILSILPIVTIYGLRTGAPFFDIVAVTFSSVIVLILLIIQAIDLYVWNEEMFSFNVYEEVLRSIGELPYYPRESIEKGRVHPGEGEYRIGTFPSRGGKERTIEVVRNGP